MKTSFSASFAFYVLCASTTVFGQEPTVPVTPVPSAPTTTLYRPAPTADHSALPTLSLSEVTPELWLYSQELRRHDDPAQAVRRKAEVRTQERMERLAALKWYGFSNSRPQAAVTPFTSSYSPTWMGNGYDRYDWAGTTVPRTVVRIETYGIQR